MELYRNMIKRSGLSLTLQEVTSAQIQGQGSYIHETKTIQLVNEQEMEQEAIRLQQFDIHLTGEELAEIICAHELGHAIDATLQITNEAIQTYFHLVSKYALSGDELMVKIYFKELYKKKIQEEKTAWELSKRFLFSSINEAEWEKYKQHCLSCYHKGIQYDFKVFFTVAKCIKKLYNSGFPFPKDTFFKINMQEKETAQHDVSTNICKLYPKFYIYNEDTSYKQMSKGTHMMYDCLYHYIKELYKMKTFKTYERELFDNFKNIDLLQHIKEAKEVILQNEIQVFSIFRPYFEKQKTFSIFEANKMAQLESDLSSLQTYQDVLV